MGAVYGVDAASRKGPGALEYPPMLDHATPTVVMLFAVAAAVVGVILIGNSIGSSY